ncbi:MAG: PKD domain-containing protein, partial [Bacteroidia bacterium]|nr:PKD domain-containing protein [Bacteroidia bacterium]
DAGQSEDDRDYPLGLMYRWDFDGDREWDTEFARNKSVAQRYKQPGTYSVAVQVKDLDGLASIAEDSIEVFGENRDIDTLIDSRDGNNYRIVKILDRWWMAENLRYGVEIPANRKQTDNDTVEMYREHHGNSKDSVVGVYSWFEAMNYRVKDPKGICPDQWHLPIQKEWEGLFTPYPPLYSVQYYGKDGLSKLNLDLNNGGKILNGSFLWTSDMTTFG